jgi:hypothetical protein
MTHKNKPTPLSPLSCFPSSSLFLLFSGGDNPLPVFPGELLPLIFVDSLLRWGSVNKLRLRRPDPQRSSLPNRQGFSSPYFYFLVSNMQAIGELLEKSDHDKTL